MARKWNLEHLPVFVQVAELLGISAAANQLNIPKSSVSKTISQLEKSLGVRLFERNSRNVRLTNEGEVFYKESLRILEVVDNAAHTMQGIVSTPSGKLTVALPIAFSREIIAPKLKDFTEQYPDIELEVVVTNQALDIIKDQIDLAVVVGAQSDSELIVKTLYKSRLCCVATPDYVADVSMSETAECLQEHVKIVESRYALRRFPIRLAQQKQHINLNFRKVRVNDPLSVREAVLNGFGVGLVPYQYCHKQLSTGQFIEVFPSIDFDVSAATLSVIYPSRRLVSNKSRAFLNFLTQCCEQLQTPEIIK